ncbi:unnamed protein product [Ilex paraguariensis]
MSASVYQGLQSCLEPRLVEPCVLRHKMSPPKSNFYQSTPWPQKPNVLRPEENKENSHNDNSSNSNNGGVDGESKSKNGDSGGWSFLQALTNKSYNFKEGNGPNGNDTQKVYVHPLVKRSSSTLSPKSLEMCTESLGSETGSDNSESMDQLSSLSLETENFRGLQRSNSREFSKKLNRSGSFPPPLTSISGSDGVRVRPYREGGRLVLKAVSVPSCNGHFQADRVNGRLRLSLLKDNSIDLDHDVVVAENSETVSNEDHDEEIEKSTNFAEAEVEEKDYDEDDNDDDDDDGDSDSDSDVGDGETEDDDDDHGGYWGEDMEGNGGKVGGEVGIGDLARPSRCKEGGSGNKEMAIWRPCWVATS